MDLAHNKISQSKNRNKKTGGYATSIETTIRVRKVGITSKVWRVVTVKWENYWRRNWSKFEGFRLEIEKKCCKTCPQDGYHKE